MEHKRLTHPGECDNPNTCNICNLFICSVCNGAEGSLPTNCPGVPMTYEQEQLVYSGDIDYRGRWIVIIKDGTNV